MLVPYIKGRMSNCWLVTLLNVSHSLISILTRHKLFNNNCGAHLMASPYITVDECLYSCRNQFVGKVYNPNKPAKFGINFKSLNDATFSYTYRSEVYCRKPELGKGSKRKKIEDRAQ